MLTKLLARASLLVLPLVAAACGGSTSESQGSGQTDSAAFAIVAPATGDVSVANQAKDRAISGFVFSNDGAADVIISDTVVTLADGTVRTSDVGFGVSAGGGGTTYLFDPSQTHQVVSLTFKVQGSTAKLVVTDTDSTGVVPVAASH